jgi:hypothetical protein
MTDAVFLAIHMCANNNDCTVYMQIRAIGHTYPGVLKSTLVSDTFHEPAWFS